MSPNDPFRVDGKVALITGAGRGIGAGIAELLASAGADVVLTARTKADLDVVAERVESLGQRALVVPGDTNDFSHIESLVSSAVGHFGRLDICVSNAGGSVPRPFLDTTVEHLESSLRFNVLAAFELARNALPHLLVGGESSIVTIGSMSGVRASRASMAHSLSKSALAQMTRLLAADLAPRIRANCVIPGAIETDALRTHVSAEARERMAQDVLMRRIGTVDDIANAVLFLVSPASSFMTGKLLEVDGAMSEDTSQQRFSDLQP